MKIEKMIVKNNQQETIEDITTEYPYVMHWADLGELIVPWHWHEEFEFGYVVSGEVEVLTLDKKYGFKANEAFFLNANVLCSMQKKPRTDTAEMNSHLFHPVFLGGHYRSIFETKYINPVLQNKKLDILEIRGENPAQKEIVKKLRQISRIQKLENMEFQTRNIVSEIWLLLLEEIERQPQDTHPVNLRNQDRMRTMLSYIHQNYTEKITVEEIASSASVSSRECVRCFGNTIGKPPIAYLMDYRLEMAKKLLGETRMSITEIGLQTGFSSNAYFGKVFREKCGVTPAEYRKQK